jgi:hypothetical protein
LEKNVTISLLVGLIMATSVAELEGSFWRGSIPTLPKPAGHAIRERRGVHMLMKMGNRRLRRRRMDGDRTDIRRTRAQVVVVNVKVKVKLSLYLPN